jgi:hypothetical protein
MVSNNIFCAPRTLIHSPLSKSKSNNSSEQSIQNDCRICYAQESPVTSTSLPGNYQLILLKNPCACKGSLSYVHEACLIKWLLQKNSRACELCKTPFIIKEEFGSFFEIMRQCFTYVMTSKRRLLKVIIYSIYLYLFFKRFAFSLKYFRNLLRNLVSSWFDKLSFSDSALSLHRKLGK